MNEFRRLLEESRRAVVFTGAGISTESGIPDFRSPGGIWTKYAPIYFDDFVRSVDAQREAWRRKFAMEEYFGAAQPNRGHRAIAELVRRGKASSVITQNIDNLHQDSGVPDAQVVELHGNGTYAACLACGMRHEMTPIRDAFLKDESLPRCIECEGVVKSATISFGQAMPESEMRRAEAVTLACDLFVAIGSSLVVYPAASFPAIAKRNGAKLVILNRDPTEMDEMADLVLNAEIGETLGSVVGVA
jgi:NAD-dependent deacetylase